MTSDGGISRLPIGTASPNRTQRLTPAKPLYTILSTSKVNKAGGWVMKWELDLWYELWDRAGSQGLDTWYDVKGEVREGPAGTRDAEGSEEIQDPLPEGA